MIGMGIRLIGTMLLSLSVVACSPIGQPMSPASRPRVSLVYRSALGTYVPVPDGWQVDDYQGTAVTVLTPPMEPIHGPRLTVEHLGEDALGAVNSRCQPSARSQPSFEGPIVIAGHLDGYQYLCQPRTFIGPEWTVLIAASTGGGTWRLTYLGATGIGKGSLAVAFTQVVAAFVP